MMLEGIFSGTCVHWYTGLVNTSIGGYTYLKIFHSRISAECSIRAAR